MAAPEASVSKQKGISKSSGVSTGAVVMTCFSVLNAGVASSFQQKLCLRSNVVSGAANWA